MDHFDNSEQERWQDAAGEPQQSQEPASQWYGVSYGEVPPRKPRGKRPWLVALLVVGALLLVLAAGVCGALWGAALRRGEAQAPVDASVTQSGQSEALRQQNDNYDYGSVVLTQQEQSESEDATAGSAGERAKTLTAAVAAVKDAVVEITATATSSRGVVSAGAGSGVIIHADGIIVTNNHVVEGYTSIYVRLTNGNTYPATVRGRDEDGDIAVLKIEPAETLTVAPLGNSASLALGEEVFVIGNPLGELGGTVSRGIISALERVIKVDNRTMTLLQTDAAINAGNSGGGLFNMAGELVGVVNAKMSEVGVEGLGFAIPIDVAMVSVQSLLTYGYIRGIPDLGVSLQNGYVRTGSGFFGSYRAVAYVSDPHNVEQLKVEDIIISIDGTEVSSTTEVTAIIRTHAVGDTVSLTVSREGQQITVTVTLTEYIPAD